MPDKLTGISHNSTFGIKHRILHSIRKESVVWSIVPSILTYLQTTKFLKKLVDLFFVALVIVTINIIMRPDYLPESFRPSELLNFVRRADHIETKILAQIRENM